MYRTYEEFWVFYVSEHLKRSTRFLHFLGTTGVILLLVWVLWKQTWWWLFLLPVLGYAPAWISHFFIERNRPATFQYPLWSLRADFRMYGLIWTGRMGGEVQRARNWLASKSK